MWKVCENCNKNKLLFVLKTKGFTFLVFSIVPYSVESIQINCRKEITGTYVKCMDKGTGPVREY